MSFGKSLASARKKSGYSQEELAEKLGISRQSVSKWELDETIPDIFQVKKMAKIFNLKIDELIEFDFDQKEMEDLINNSNEEKESKVDWTKAWSKRYPILKRYQGEVDIKYYAYEIRKLLNELKDTYHYSEVDAVLVLKDILAKEMRR